MGRCLVFLRTFVWILVLSDRVCIAEKPGSFGAAFRGGALAGEGRCWDDSPGGGGFSCWWHFYVAVDSWCFVL